MLNVEWNGASGRTQHSTLNIQHSTFPLPPRPKKFAPPFWGGASSLLDVRGANAQGREFKSVRFKEVFKRVKL
jgi:hypothetical protein